MSPSPLPKRYFNPKIDMAFRRVFGVHANVLKSFLNALLPLPADAQIDSLEYLTPEQAPDIPGLFRPSIIDVKCTDRQGSTFIVEIQLMWRVCFEQPMAFEAGEAYVKQLRVGQTWREREPVYALVIFNDTFAAASGVAADDCYHHYRIVNVIEPKQMLAGLEFVFIELPKFRPEGRGEKRLQTLWLRFLREVGAVPTQVLHAELLQDPDIAQALGLLEQGGFTDAELAGYDTAFYQITTYISMLADAEASGLARGEAKARGRAVGERAKALAIGSALLADGLSLERVAAATGLSTEELRALQGGTAAPNTAPIPAQAKTRR